MKINNLFISLFGLIVLVLTSCEKPFDELEKDPNRPVNAPASLVLKGVLADVFGATGSAWDDRQRWISFTPAITTTTPPTSIAGRAHHYGSRR